MCVCERERERERERDREREIMGWDCDVCIGKRKEERGGRKSWVLANKMLEQNIIMVYCTQVLLPVF